MRCVIQAGVVTSAVLLLPTLFFILRPIPIQPEPQAAAPAAVIQQRGELVMAPVLLQKTQKEPELEQSHVLPQLEATAAAASTRTLEKEKQQLPRVVIDLGAGRTGSNFLFGQLRLNVPELFVHYEVFGASVYTNPRSKYYRERLMNVTWVHEHPVACLRLLQEEAKDLGKKYILLKIFEHQLRHELVERLFEELSPKPWVILHQGRSLLRLYASYRRANRTADWRAWKDQKKWKQSKEVAVAFNELDFLEYAKTMCQWWDQAVRWIQQYDLRAM